MEDVSSASRNLRSVLIKKKKKLLEYLTAIGPPIRGEINPFQRMAKKKLIPGTQADV